MVKHCFFHIFCCAFARMWSGQHAQDRHLQGGDCDMWPNQMQTQLHLNTFCQHDPRFCMPKTTNSFSNPHPLHSHFEGTRPTTMAQHNCFSQNSYFPFSYNEYPGKLSFEHRSVRCRSPADPNARLLRQGCWAGNETPNAAGLHNIFQIPGHAFPSYFQPEVSSALHPESLPGLRSPPDQILLRQNDLIRLPGQTAMQERSIRTSDKYFQPNECRMSFSPLLKREYCLFRANFHHGTAENSNMSWHGAEKSFFENIDSSFKPPGDRTLRKWWNKRNKYLSEEELSMCPLDNLSPMIWKVNQLDIPILWGISPTKWGYPCFCIGHPFGDIDRDIPYISISLSVEYPCQYPLYGISPMISFTNV